MPEYTRVKFTVDVSSNADFSNPYMAEEFARERVVEEFVRHRIEATASPSTVSLGSIALPAAILVRNLGLPNLDVAFTTSNGAVTVTLSGNEFFFCEDVTSADVTLTTEGATSLSDVFVWGT